MKLHIGVGSRTGLAHSAAVTAVNVHDKHPIPQLKLKLDFNTSPREQTRSTR